LSRLNSAPAAPRRRVCLRKDGSVAARRNLRQPHRNPVTAQVVPQKAACGRARDRKANFSSANSPTDRVSEGYLGTIEGYLGSYEIRGPAEMDVAIDGRQ